MEFTLYTLNFFLKIHFLMVKCNHLVRKTLASFGLYPKMTSLVTIEVFCNCKVMIFKYVFCWLLFCAKFDCNFIQSYVPYICCENLLYELCDSERECEDSSN